MALTINLINILITKNKCFCSGSVPHPCDFERRSVNFISQLCYFNSRNRAKIDKPQILGDHIHSSREKTIQASTALFRYNLEQMIVSKFTTSFLDSQDRYLKLIFSPQNNDSSSFEHQTNYLQNIFLFSTLEIISQYFVEMFSDFFFLYHSTRYA